MSKGQEMLIIYRALLTHAECANAYHGIGRVELQSSSSVEK